MPLTAIPTRRLRVLLDAHIDKRLKESITEHDVWTARDQRLENLLDGQLLDVIDGRFDVLVTMDKSLRFQNRLKGRSFGVILLRAKSNRISDLLPIVPALLLTIPEVKPGEVIEIGQ